MSKLAMSLVIVLLAFAKPTSSYALTLSEWEQKEDSWKQAYVLAVGEYLMTIVVMDSESSMSLSDAYGKCFAENKFNSSSVTKLVGRYVLVNPKASTEPMLINVLNALREACSRYLPNVEN